jgi:hypothetical protein
MKYHKSYQSQKYSKTNALCAKMRKAKEQKRLNSPPPDYPDQIDNILRCAWTWGDGSRHDMTLQQKSKRSYHVWVDHIYKGIMGLSKAREMIWR